MVCGFWHYQNLQPPRLHTSGSGRGAGGTGHGIPAASLPSRPPGVLSPPAVAAGEGAPGPCPHLPYLGRERAPSAGRRVDPGGPGEPGGHVAAQVESGEQHGKLWSARFTEYKVQKGQ